MIKQSTNSQYYENVYKGYKFLWREASEVFWHQLFFDPIQDSILKKSFESIIKYGHNREEVRLEPDYSFHKLLHKFGGSSFAHSAQGFLVELAIHGAVKIVATASYPFIYAMPSEYSLPAPLNEYLFKPTVKFFGIHPLEIVNSVKVLPNQILGEFNPISETIDYLTLHKNHFHDRAVDREFSDFMDGYNHWMETIDAAMHAFDDLSIFYLNRNLPFIYQKFIYWLELKFKFFHNTQNADHINEYKVNYLRESHHVSTYNEATHNVDEDFCPYSEHSITETLYNISSFVLEQIPYLVLPLYFYYMNNGNFFYAPPSDSSISAAVNNFPSIESNTAIITQESNELIQQTNAQIPRSLSLNHLLDHFRLASEFGIRSTKPDSELLDQNNIDVTFNDPAEPSKSNQFEQTIIDNSETPAKDLKRSKSSIITDNEVEEYNGPICGFFDTIQTYIKRDCDTPNCKLSRSKYSPLNKPKSRGLISTSKSMSDSSKSIAFPQIHHSSDSSDENSITESPRKGPLYYKSSNSLNNLGAIMETEQETTTIDKESTPSERIRQVSDNSGATTTEERSNFDENNTNELIGEISPYNTGIDN